MDWNLGVLFRITEASSDPFQIAMLDFDSKRRCSWGELAQASDRVAGWLQARGLVRGDKVALYSRNRIEYMIALIAIFKVGLVHVNINFRYKHEELLYLFEDSDVQAVFYSAENAGPLVSIRSKLPGLRIMVEFTDDQPIPGLQGATAFASIISQAQPAPVFSESPDDLFFMYTGGTTGMPKGVIWKHCNLFQVIGTNWFAEGGPRKPEDYAEFTRMVENRPAFKGIINAPWMHSTGLYCVFSCMIYGGTLVFNGDPGFSAERTWDAIAGEKIRFLNVTGDAMAKPLVDALKSNPGRWNLDGLEFIMSAAMVFSVHLKRELIHMIPQLTVMDGLGSSESSAVGGLMLNRHSIDAYRDEDGLRLVASDTVKVFRDDLTEVTPGSGEAGMVATGGPISEGYYKDPVKTERTYKVVNGKRYCIMGDYAEVLPDGTLRFLGRGNVCINTGGEKVYPEEVESVLKRHPAVADCAIVGVPDERWGSAVTAVIRLEPGATVEADSLQQHIRKNLSGYKVPRHILINPDLTRGLNGKLDYMAMREFAIANVPQP